LDTVAEYTAQNILINQAQWFSETLWNIQLRFQYNIK